MFADHQPKISECGRSNPAAFSKVCEFALATIRVHLRDACAALRDGERPSKVFFGSKLDGLAYLDRHAEALWNDAEQAHDDDALMAVFMRIPGIGLAKAGFLCQMLYGRVGCLDTHNLVRFGLPPRTFTPSLPSTSAKCRWRIIRQYVETCEQLGGCAELWDSWCEYVANREGDRPETISALHLAAI